MSGSSLSDDGCSLGKEVLLVIQGADKVPEIKSSQSMFSLELVLASFDEAIHGPIGLLTCTI